MVNTYTTLADIKQHLNIETEFTDDDDYIVNLISVAEMSVYEYLNGGLSGSTINITVDGETITALPKSIKHAIVLLTAHFYLNRALVSFAQGYELPYAFKFLLNPYRIMVVQ